MSGWRAVAAPAGLACAVLLAACAAPPEAPDAAAPAATGATRNSPGASAARPAAPAVAPVSTAAAPMAPVDGAPQQAVPTDAAPAADADADHPIEQGRASWYGKRFHGRRTASGERFDMNALTAAHRTLPFGTRVRVRNPLNGREVEVRINDRGPHLRGRIIDLSHAAAAALGLVHVGDAAVVLLPP